MSVAVQKAQWPDVFQGELLPDPVSEFDPHDIEVAVAELRPDREVHDWDGATGLVTTRIRCTIDGHPVWGAGIARSREQATRLALASAHARANSATLASS